jgi:hypothetical protein
MGFSDPLNDRYGSHPGSLVRQTIDKMTGIWSRRPLDTRMTWVGDRFERIDVHGRGSRAVAICK